MRRASWLEVAPAKKKRECSDRSHLQRVAVRALRQAYCKAYFGSLDSRPQPPRQRLMLSSRSSLTLGEQGAAVVWQGRSAERNAPGLAPRPPLTPSHCWRRRRRAGPRSACPCGGLRRLEARHQLLRLCARGPEAAAGRAAPPQAALPQRAHLAARGDAGGPPAAPASQLVQH